MTTDTQDAGTATHDAGGTQNADQTTATADTTQATQTGDASKDTTTAGAEAEYKFEMPEGVELNQEDLAKFTDVAKELKLPADAAKKLVDLAAAREVARANAFAKQVEDWGNQVKADPELGKPENLAAAKNAIDTFGTPELRDLLNSTGMGNHPEVVRLAVKIGKAISEDTFVAGRTNAGPAPRSHADILYGTSPSK